MVNPDAETKRRNMLKMGAGIFSVFIAGVGGYEWGYRRAEARIPEDSSGDMIPDTVDAFPNQKNEAAYVTQLEQTFEIEPGSYRHFDISTPEVENRLYILEYSVEVVEGSSVDIITLAEPDFERYKGRDPDITPLYGSAFGVNSNEYGSIKTGEVLVLDNTEMGSQESELPTQSITVQITLKVYPQVHPANRVQYEQSSKYPSLWEFGGISVLFSIGIATGYSWYNISKKAVQGDLTWKTVLVSIGVLLLAVVGFILLLHL